MSEFNLESNRFIPAKRKQGGTTAVEFAGVVLVVLLAIFGTIEIARAMYVFNTLQEVTRRAAAAAAKADFTVPSAMAQVKQEAIFRNDRGPLLLGDPVTDDNIVIDYMSIARAGNSLALVPNTSMPGSPAENRAACMKDPYADNCIQFVRVRVCSTADASSCAPVIYQTLFPLVSLPLELPVSTTIVKVDALNVTCLPCTR